MRLINFGPGEISDRLSILHLKIQYGKVAGKPIEHFERERNALLTKMPTLTSRSLEASLELAAINAMIWQDTERVRQLRAIVDAPAPFPIGVSAELANLACRMQKCNDERGALITIVNVNTGNLVEGEEKV